MLLIDVAAYCIMCVCTHLYEGMDDLRGIISEVQRTAQFLNGLHGSPEEKHSIQQRKFMTKIYL